MLQLLKVVNHFMYCRLACEFSPVDKVSLTINTTTSTTNNNTSYVFVYFILYY